MREEFQRLSASSALSSCFSPWTSWGPAWLITEGLKTQLDALAERLPSASTARRLATVDE